MMMKQGSALQSSFRDPAGTVFVDEGCVYRQIHDAGCRDYDMLMNSGLYHKLVSNGLIVEHHEVPAPVLYKRTLYRIIRPQMIQFVSYPYEWTFGQLKDAALATLSIQEVAIEHGMILKDASAYNIQFHMGRPVLIDTLSFTVYTEGMPWPAYGQFCRHFLAPLALMAKVDVRVSKLLRDFVDGIPLDLAARLLPARSRLIFGILMHIFLHAQSQNRHADSDVSKQAGNLSGKKISRLGLIGIIQSLKKTVSGLEWRPEGTEWGNYYENTNYTDTAFKKKKDLVAGYIRKVKPRSVWDIGGNTGVFGRLASDAGIPTVCFDIDPVAVEVNYRETKKRNETNMLPLVLDLVNPSPSLGWNCSERESIVQRAPSDCLLALALVHHLAISNNLPFDLIAGFLQKMCKYLVIEFVPKEDSQVVKLLRTRPDIFNEYSKQNFEKVFGKYFVLQDESLVDGSMRTLYLMKSRRGKK